MTIRAADLKDPTKLASLAHEGQLASIINAFHRKRQAKIYPKKVWIEPPTPEPKEPPKPRLDFMYPTIKKIGERVSKRHNVTLGDLVGRRYPKLLRAARAEWWWCIRDETSFSYPQIGRSCKRDHTTIVYAVNNRSEEIGKQPRRGRK